MIASGHKHSVAISPEGVWTFGDDTEGQLGLGEVPGISSAAGRRTVFEIPQKIPSLVNVVSASCGEEFTVCLDSNGDVWSFGANRGGFLGLGHSNAVLVPSKVEGLPVIRSVACGGFHTFCISEDSSLWTFGRNSNGQLGVGDRKHRTKPCQVPVNNIISVAAGRTHSIIINESNQALTCGSHQNGQCGIPSVADILSFTLVETPDIVAASAGFYHTILLDSNGTVHGCGDIHALKGKKSCISVIPGLENIKLIGCGEEHSLCVDTEGNLFSFGKGYYGQLGTGKTSAVPTKLSISNVLAISIGGNHSIVKDAENQIWCFGNNGFGQLGLGHKTPTVMHPEMMSEELSHIIGVYKPSSKKSARK